MPGGAEKNQEKLLLQLKFVSAEILSLNIRCTKVAVHNAAVLVNCHVCWLTGRVRNKCAVIKM